MIAKVKASLIPLLSRHRTESRVLVLFVGLIIAVLTFVKAASEVLEGDTFAVDRAVLLALRTPGDVAIPVGPKWLPEAMIDLTSLGSTTVLTTITMLATGFLLAARKPVMAIFTGVAISSGALLGTALKGIYARPRPDLIDQLVGVHSPSFPSGHAMNSAVVYLTLAVLIARTIKDHSVRIYLVAMAIALTLVIGFSRIYLGVHWPTDVLAGWCVGGTWAALCSMAAKSLQPRHKLDGSASPAATER